MKHWWQNKIKHLGDIKKYILTHPVILIQIRASRSQKKGGGGSRFPIYNPTKTFSRSSIGQALQKDFFSPSGREGYSSRFSLFFFQNIFANSLAGVPEKKKPCVLSNNISSFLQGKPQKRIVLISFLPLDCQGKKKYMHT